MNLKKFVNYMIVVGAIFFAATSSLFGYALGQTRDEDPKNTIKINQNGREVELQVVTLTVTEDSALSLPYDNLSPNGERKILETVSTAIENFPRWQGMRNKRLIASRPHFSSVDKNGNRSIDGWDVVFEEVSKEAMLLPKVGFVRFNKPVKFDGTVSQADLETAIANEFRRKNLGNEVLFVTLRTNLSKGENGVNTLEVLGGWVAHVGKDDFASAEKARMKSRQPTVVASRQ